MRHNFFSRCVGRERASLPTSNCIALSVCCNAKIFNQPFCLKYGLLHPFDRVCFPKTVRWMCLEFDSQCCTSQVEDYLQLFLPSANPKSRGHAFNISDYWPVLRKFSGSDNWPSNSLLLPGKQVFKKNSLSYYKIFIIFHIRQRSYFFARNSF